MYSLRKKNSVRILNPHTHFFLLFFYATLWVMTDREDNSVDGKNLK